MVWTIMEFIWCICTICIFTSIVVLGVAREDLKDKFNIFMRKHRIVAAMYWIMCLISVMYTLYSMI